MDRALTTFLVAFVFTIAQFSLGSFFGFYGLHPDLLFVLLFVFSFKTPKNSFYFLAFFVGLFVDLLSFGRFGYITVLHVLVGFVLFYYLRHFSFGIMQKVVGLVLLWCALKIGVPKIVSGYHVALLKSLIDLMISCIFIPLALFVVRMLFNNKEYKARGIQLRLGS